MKVTVLLPVYNGERHIREAVDSVLAQTYRDFDLLVIDDGSTDGTAAILDSYRDRRMRVVHQPNTGRSRALNRGIGMIASTYVARLDADDVMEPERIEEQVRFLDAHLEVGLLGTACMEIAEDGRATAEMVLPTDDARLRDVMLAYNPFYHPSVMLRREVFDRVGLYDERIRHAEDYDLWFRVARLYKVANLARPLTRKRTEYAGSESVRRERAQVLEAMRIRWAAIRAGDYPIWRAVWLARPAAMLFLPYAGRRALRRLMRRGGRVVRV